MNSFVICASSLHESVFPSLHLTIWRKIESMAASSRSQPSLQKLDGVPAQDKGGDEKHGHIHAARLFHTLQALFADRLPHYVLMNTV
jgi:hypothetical protein